LGGFFLDKKLLISIIIVKKTRKMLAQNGRNPGPGLWKPPTPRRNEEKKAKPDIVNQTTLL
jgi:hypothetical protein